MTKFAKRLKGMEKSAAIVRNIFNGMNDPEIISFGGGAPAKEGLPVDMLREIADDVMRKESRGLEALQYGGVMGIKDLREFIARELLAPKDIDAQVENIMIVNGGLEGLYLLCRSLIDPGDVILVESPTFVHAVEVFELIGAKCIACEMDDNGVIVENVEVKIKQYNPKMIYTIPTFHNPTGKTLSQTRRKRMAELGSKHDVIILEDDPYSELRYSGETLKPIKAFDKTGHTVFANSFSKIFSPGTRLGYIVGNDEIMKHLFDVKTATNSHTSTLCQVLASEFFNRGYFSEHLKNLCDLHRKRRDVMMACLDKYFPEGTKHTYPDGGLFTWVDLPNKIDTTEMLEEAERDYKVSYLGGECFFTEGGGKGRNSMRISFGNVTTEKIKEGTERLGALAQSKMKQVNK